MVGGNQKTGFLWGKWVEINWEGPGGVMLVFLLLIGVLVTGIYICQNPADLLISCR